MAIQDQNLDDLISNWHLFKDRLVIFLGAGASIGAQNRSGLPLPNAYDLRNSLWAEFKHAGPGPFVPEELRLMTLEHAAAIIETKTGRVPLNEYLVRAFTCDRTLWQHGTLPHLSPSALFTTNYDELIELGFGANRGPVLDVICSDRSPISGRTALYKPHGSLTLSDEKVGQGGLVITQFDYLEMISDYRKMLERAMTGFGKTCVLIIGYSFGDMDIGAQLYSLRKESPGIPWYAVFPRSDPQVRKMYSRRFGIEQIDATFEAFIRELDNRLDILPPQWKYVNKANLQAASVVQ